MPANFSGALLKQPSGRGNKARRLGRTGKTPNQPSSPCPRCDAFLSNLVEEARTPGSQIDNEHENDDEHDWAEREAPNQSSPSPCPPFPPCPPCDAFLSNLAEEARPLFLGALLRWAGMLNGG
jgi:hypothetical protein